MKKVTVVQFSVRGSGRGVMVEAVDKDSDSGGESGDDDMAYRGGNGLGVNVKGREIVTTVGGGDGDYGSGSGEIVLVMMVIMVIV